MCSFRKVTASLLDMAHASGLAMLDLLQSAAFRERMRHEDATNELARLQSTHAALWRMPPRPPPTTDSAAQV